MREFVDLIDRKYISTPTEYRPINFAHTAQYFALDVISRLGWGESIGFLANDKDVYKYIEINETAMPFLALALAIPWVDKYLKMWPLRLFMPSEGDEVGFGRLIG